MLDFQGDTEVTDLLSDTNNFFFFGSSSIILTQRSHN